MKVTEFQAKVAVESLLAFAGEDVKREGLLNTPNRVVKMYGELFSGYQKDPADIMTVFEDGACDEMVVLRDIEFYSMCEHHVLPFFGKAHIAYIPDGKVLGISKLARLLDIYSKRMQIQERIGRQVTDALMKYLEPKGAACVIEAQHLCMLCRGVMKQNSVMVTSSLSGVFLHKEGPREELLKLIHP
jgi:GTP cyclohydrolase I